MLSSDFRKIARRKLEGKWGNAVCILLAYMLVSFIISIIEKIAPETGIIAFILSVVVLIIEIPLSFGIIYAFFKLFHGEEVKAFSFWSLGFDNFRRAWGVAFRIILKLAIPIILIILAYILMSISIVQSATSIITGSSSSSGLLALLAFILIIVASIWGTVKSFYYVLAEFVAFDNPNLTPSECVLKSQELMTNRRGKFFFLQLSFIGWIILATFTFGIGLLCLIPYMQLATIAFYDFYAHDKKDEIE